MRWTPEAIVFAVAAAACAIAHVAILGSVLRRASSVESAGVPRPRFVAEIVWAILPALALAFLLTATWGRVRENSATPPHEVMKVAR